MDNRRGFLKKGVLSSLFFIPGVNWLNRNPFSMSDYPVDSLNGDFLYNSNKTYLNTASLGLSPKVVVEEISESLKELEGLGRDGRWLFDECRAKIAAFVNAKENEITITRNATEGMNIMARSIDLKAGDEILITTHEHVGGILPWLGLHKELGLKVRAIELDLSGETNVELLINSITNKTKVISFSHLLCTTGMVLDAKKIASACKEKGVFSCVDGAQALGSIPLDLSDIDADFYSASGHKWLFGPKGSGVLYVNERTLPKLKATYVGAYSDASYSLKDSKISLLNKASRFEYGTRNASIVRGLSTAIDFVSSKGIQWVYQHGIDLHKHLTRSLSQIKDVEVLSPTNDKYISPICTFRFRNTDNKRIVGKLRSEHQMVIRHIYENDLDAIRVSNAIYNSKEDIDQLVQALKEI